MPHVRQPQRYVSFSRAGQLAAWGVHLYTASGALAAFLGVLAVFEGRYRAAFFWMIVATVIDCSDGVLARMTRVTERVPEIDGARLDNIVDYLTYVFLPLLLLYHAGDVPAGWGLAVVSAALLSSAFGFAADDAKTDDHFFTGFPSYWNVAALYLHAGGLPPAVNAVILLALAVLVFVRVRYVYPSRTETLRGVTVVLGIVWAVMVSWIVWRLPDAPGTLVIGSLVFPVYYTVLSVYLHNRLPRAAGRSPA